MAKGVAVCAAQQGADVVISGRDEAAAEVEDQVPGILYLLSDYSQMTTGANLRMTGGLYF